MMKGKNRQWPIMFSLMRQFEKCILNDSSLLIRSTYENNRIIKNKTE